MRAGSQTLTLLATSRIFLILKSLEQETKGRLELRRDTGFPAQSTLRGQLAALEAAGLTVKHRPDSFPGALEYGLAEPGHELLEVAAGLERWLAEAPQGPLELGGDAAKAAIKGLVESWATSVLTTLAEGPYSLTELDKRISTVSYPTIERCLETMRLAQQLDAGARDSRGMPYALTDWLRRGLAPLALAARWEHCNGLKGAVPVSRLDIDGAIMVAAPLLALPPRLSGICQLAVKAAEDEGRRRFLASLEVHNGSIAFGAVYPERKPDAWASATAETWFSTVIDAQTRGLRLSGDRKLAHTVFDRLHRALFEDEARKPKSTTKGQA